jgi:hypothetical protein
MTTAEFPYFVRNCLLTLSCFPAPSDPFLRLHTLTLVKLSGFWRRVIADEAPDQTTDKNLAAISLWFFQNRRFLVHPNSGSHADGFRAAAAMEDCLAETLSRTAIPNFGNLEESLEEVRTREVALTIP